MFFRLFGNYNQLLVRRPLVTQSATAATLYAIGDTLAQIAENKANGRVDFYRTARMTAIGGLALGPSMSIWYRFLERRIALQSHRWNTILRVSADQLIFAPISIAGFFGLTELIQVTTGSKEERLGKAKTRIGLDFVPTLAQNYKIWPAIQMFNFFLTPLRFRLLVSNTVTIFWTAYLSVTANKEHSERSQYQ